MIMKQRTFSWSVVAVLGVLGAGFAAPMATAAPAVIDGLVQKDARGLDEIYVRPDTNFQGFRKVIVEPGTVAMRPGWLKSINSTRGPSRWLVPQDVQDITDQAAKDLAASIAKTFRAKGYEVVTAPGPGVLTVTPKVTDLFVNAPGAASANMQALFNVTAGEATLTMDVRDAATGVLLAHIVDRGTAHELSNRINRSFTVTNQFWFDALFSRWTENCIAGLDSSKIAAN
jgi:hypothetical protein